MGNVLPIVMSMLHSHIAWLERKSFSGAQKALDLRDECVGVGRLDDDLIEAGIARAIQLSAVGIPRRGNKRNAAGVGIRAQMLRCVETRNMRQLEVEDDQIREQFLRLGNRLGAIAGRRDLISHRPQVQRPDVESIRVIVHDQNVFPCTHHNTSCADAFQALCQTDERKVGDTLSNMQPNLAQVLNTLAHEIRTPLAVSLGYLKLLIDGRITNADDARKAMEQTRQALGALATLCMDMGKVSALSESKEGALTTTSSADFISNLQSLEEVKDAAWQGDAGARAIQSANARELAQAVAIVAKAAFDEQRDSPRTIRIDSGEELVVLAGSADALPSLPSGPDAPNARAVDFVKGGKGLKLIWAAFVLDKHGVQAWADTQQRASVGIRIPLVQA